MSDRPIPKSLLQEAMSNYSVVVSKIAQAGVRTIGPVLAAAVLDFAAKAVEQKAVLSGEWNDEQSAQWRISLAKSLGELRERWEKRRAAEKPK